jgi:hypothetical protein
LIHVSNHHNLKVGLVPLPQVWVVPELRDDGKIYWTADSDSQLTKGLAALLVLGLSGCSPAEILSVQPGFIEMLGLKQSLTPSRNNGFLNMFLKMQKLTLGLVVSGGWNRGSLRLVIGVFDGQGMPAGCQTLCWPGLGVKGRQTTACG